MQYIKLNKTILYKKFFFNIICLWLVLLTDYLYAEEKELIPHNCLLLGIDDKQIKKLSNKQITDIDIIIRPVFENPSNLIYKTANKLKISTKKIVIQREMFFQKNDYLNLFKLQESERILRSLSYLREPNLYICPNKTGVKIIVSVQDTWTLLPQLSYSTSAGKNKKEIGIADSNFIGYGNRLEVLLSQEDNRDSIELVFDDRRIAGFNTDMILGYFDRTDGERFIAGLGKPFRGLVGNYSWKTIFDYSNFIGRLFDFGEENFIYRKKNTEVTLRYTFARGDPSVRTKRYSLGYQYTEDNFSQAKQKDFETLNLDPNQVSNNISLLAENRRLSGPVFTFELVEPNFISLAYIDNFSRVQDFNLGNKYNLSLFIAPKFLGSLKNYLNITANYSKGIKFNKKSFIRGEVGFSSRVEQEDGFVNSLFRFENRYYNSIGDKTLGKLYLGNHTIAGSFFFDYGLDLDNDRQLLVGAENILRGYKARAFEGDKRIGLIIEERAHLFENILDLFNLGYVIFAEVGGATRDNFNQLITNKLYADIGIGIRLGFPRSTGERVLRLDIAFPLRDADDGTDFGSPRITLGAGQIFNAFLSTEIKGAEKASVDVGFDR